MPPLQASQYQHTPPSSHSQHALTNKEKKSQERTSCHLFMLRYQLALTQLEVCTSFTELERWTSVHLGYRRRCGGVKAPGCSTAVGFFYWYIKLKEDVMRVSIGQMKMKFNVDGRRNTLLIACSCLCLAFTGKDTVLNAVFVSFTYWIWTFNTVLFYPNCCLRLGGTNISSTNLIESIALVPFK